MYWCEVAGESTQSADRQNHHDINEIVIDSK